CRSRRQGQSAARPRARSADLPAIFALDLGPAAWRPRLFLRLGKAGAGRDPAADSDHGALGRPGADLLRVYWHSLGRAARGAPRHAAGLFPARGQPQRIVAALVLARAVDLDG